MILNIQSRSGEKKVACTRTLIQIRMFSSETIPQNANDAGDLAWWGNESKRVHTLLSTEVIELENIPWRQTETSLFHHPYLSGLVEGKGEKKFPNERLQAFGILTHFNATQFFPVKQVLSA